MSASNTGERIAKRLARAGIASRREAERMIAVGRVAVDGVVLTSLAVIVTLESRIEVDGVTLRDPQPSRLWRYHKPKGLIASGRNIGSGPTIFEHLPVGA